MSDQEDTSYDEQEQTFTQSQVENIIELFTRRLRDEQLQESENRTRGNPLPSTIVEELDHYAKTADSLSKAIQKYKKEIPKYNSEDWITAETHNPNFIGELKQHKVDSLQFTNLIYSESQNPFNDLEI